MRRKTSNVKRVVLVVLALLVGWGLGAGGCEVVDPLPPISPISPVSPVGLQHVSVHSAPGRVSLVNPVWPEYPGEPQGGDLELLCQLRRGGAQGVVASQARLISWGRTHIPFLWDVSGLEPGWYEVLCRLSAPGGQVLHLIEPTGQDCVEGCGFGFVEHFKLE
jgi:hypothetical protein